MIHFSFKHMNTLASQLLRNKIVGLAPAAGFEPAANRLTVYCSTAELRWNELQVNAYTLIRQPTITIN